MKGHVRKHGRGWAVRGVQRVWAAEAEVASRGPEIALVPRHALM